MVSYQELGLRDVEEAAPTLFGHNNVKRYQMEEYLSKYAKEYKMKYLMYNYKITYN